MINQYKYTVQDEEKTSIWTLSCCQMLMDHVHNDPVCTDFKSTKNWVLDVQRSEISSEENM